MSAVVSWPELLFCRHFLFLPCWCSVQPHIERKISNTWVHLASLIHSCQVGGLTLRLAVSSLPDPTRPGFMGLIQNPSSEFVCCDFLCLCDFDFSSFSFLLQFLSGNIVCWFWTLDWISTLSLPLSLGVFQPLVLCFVRSSSGVFRRETFHQDYITQRTWEAILEIFCCPGLNPLLLNSIISF